MREGESADSDSGPPSSTDDFSDEHLQKLRDDAIRRPVEELRERQAEIEAWKTTKGNTADQWRYRESWDDDEPAEQKLGNHGEFEDLSASETRELIDAVSTENGHMSGNHDPTPSHAPGVVRSRHYADGPGDGSVDGGLVEQDAATPNHFETRAATRIGSKQQRFSESGSDGLAAREGGWSDAATPLDDRGDPAGDSFDTEGMNHSVDYEKLARHNDGRSRAWSHGGGDSYSQWASQQDKTSIAETYCRFRLDLNSRQTRRITEIIEGLDFDRFGQQRSLEKVTLATINAVRFVDIDHYEHLRESAETDDHSVSRSAEFKKLRESQEMSLSDLKKLTEKVREQL